MRALFLTNKISLVKLLFLFSSAFNLFYIYENLQLFFWDSAWLRKVTFMWFWHLMTWSYPLYAKKTTNVKCRPFLTRNWKNFSHSKRYGFVQNLMNQGIMKSILKSYSTSLFIGGDGNAQWVWHNQIIFRNVSNPSILEKKSQKWLLFIFSWAIPLRYNSFTT